MRRDSRRPSVHGLLSVISLRDVFKCTSSITAILVLWQIYFRHDSDPNFSNDIMHTIITDNIYEHLSWAFNVLLVGTIVGRHPKVFYVNI